MGHFIQPLQKKNIFHILGKSSNKWLTMGKFIQFCSHFEVEIYDSRLTHDHGISLPVTHYHILLAIK